MSKRDLQLLLGDIVNCANKILKYTSGLTYEQFLMDDMMIDATVRNFEIIGEASNRIPEDYKLKHPEIDWIGIVGLRNRIVHEYFGIDYSQLWQIKEEYVEELRDWVETLIEQ